MQDVSRSGVFLKHFVQYGKTEMRQYTHRNDYYIVALLTAFQGYRRGKEAACIYVYVG